MFEKLVPELRPKYGIKPEACPMGYVSEWAFLTLEDARAKAAEISREQHVSVLIFRIIGECYQETSWVDYE